MKKNTSARSSAQPEAKELTWKKRLLFWIILLGIPLFALLVLEVLLRVFDYGGSLDLVVRTSVAGKEYYTLNREVGRRYFSQKGIAIPEAFDDLFEIEKRPGTRRIFMLGESTMAGFPFDYNATAPRLLQDRLRESFPDRNIEVINVGLAAVNSYTVLDLIQELVHYQPDAFVVYLGHNEYYGAFGIGSTEYLGRWRSLVNLYLRMEKFKSFLLVRDAISYTTGLFRNQATPKDASLMASMVREKSILHGSSDYLVARENYEANLRSIIQVAREAHVPLVLSTLTSNIRDQVPLLASFCTDRKDAEKERWQKLIEEGKQALGQRNFSAAVTFIRTAAEIDSCNADAFFHMGNAYDSLGNYREAHAAYSKARDLDALRFRASTDYNTLLHRIASETGTPLAEVERAFEAESPHGLVGDNLMLEHLHPNFDGYFLLAKTFFLSLREHTLLASSAEWALAPTRTDEFYRKISGVTELTIETANIRTFSLTHGWPFMPQNAERPAFKPRSKVQEIALEYTDKRMPWSSAHLRLAEWYRSQEEYARAYDEYYALSKVAWYNYQPFMHMGDLARLLERSAQAESLYLHALRLQENPFVNVRLGMLYFELNRFSDAVARFEATVANSRKSSEGLGVKEQSLARYFLGAAYGKQGNVEKARMNLQVAVGLDSSNTEARLMLSQIHPSTKQPQR